MIDIEAMRKVLLEGKAVEYKAHCLKRMVERRISREDIKTVFSMEQLLRIIH